MSPKAEPGDRTPIGVAIQDSRMLPDGTIVVGVRMNFSRANEWAADYRDDPGRTPDDLAALRLVAEAARMYLESASSCVRERNYFNPRVPEDEKRLQDALAALRVGEAKKKETGRTDPRALKERKMIVDWLRRDTCEPREVLQRDRSLADAIERGEHEKEAG